MQIKALTPGAVQDERIKVLQDQVAVNTKRLTDLELHGTNQSQEALEDYKNNEARITELEQSVWVWKGVVFGFGSFISLIEILQALGIVGTLKLKRPA